MQTHVTQLIVAFAVSLKLLKFFLILVTIPSEYDKAALGDLVVCVCVCVCECVSV